ncbi:D-aspartate oxidase [Dunckerocampus dactyliophorus]|uniref:D-aspartate oxidase n=1 Tax=Dunckerocampus dactyliophorus TaxID=161453 RepID=UPI002406E118|nr:D-aspartate oxidase [Dunckerocampus dactyliophorus]
MKQVKVVVVGAGVVGLSAAVCIAEALPVCSVTLLADKFSPDTTSDVAAGIVFAEEYPDIPLERQRRWFQDSFEHLLAIAQSAHSPEAGVSFSSGCQIFKEPPANKTPYWSDIVFGFRFLSERELNRFPCHTFGQAFTTIRCECSRYLPWLLKRFQTARGHMEQKKVSSLQELGRHYDVIVNCSGLGSRAVAGDGQVYPIRGQVLRAEAPWLEHFIRDSDGNTYIYPGAQYVTLGGTRQVGDERLQVDRRDSESILERCTLLEPSLRRAWLVGEWVGLRPGRRNPRVEREVLEVNGHGRVHVVHNYGHGGWGVSVAWGTAVDTMRLVRKCLQELSLPAKL